MGQYFKQDEVFPVVARLILSLSRSKKAFVAHDDLVEAFLKDSLGKKLVDHAYTLKPEQSSSQHDCVV